MDISNQHVERVIWEYIERYLAGNRMAARVNEVLVDAGIGIRPVIDHISIRTHDIQERALEFEALGYLYDDRLGVLERGSWWGKVYRRSGFPAVFLDQAFPDARGAESALPQWIEKFTDGQLHHVAITVDNIEHAVERYRSLGVTFTGEITGEPMSTFRQIYSDPEIVDGEPFTLLELVERRWGYAGFLPPVDSSPMLKHR
jgi:catechol 2,3-dioxygenase-like lactoylglutathione lyase family enzyme